MRTHACTHMTCYRICVTLAHFIFHMRLSKPIADPDHVARIRMPGLLVRTGSTTELHATRPYDDLAHSLKTTAFQPTT